MKPCPKCQSTSRVIDSRQNYEHTYRRRECNKCAHTWTTYEIHSDQFDKISKYNQLQIIFSDK
jgi:transcriptional regulator NrdR family protein